jgi:nucleotide-binding universal stress UspA family protein
MINHILVPLDGSSLAECVLPHVVAVARAFDAQVTLLQVVEPPRGTGPLRSVDPFSWKIVRSEAKAYLSGVELQLQAALLRTDSILLEGPVAERVIQFAHGNDVRLIILSSHGRSGLSGWNVSSVVQKIMLRAYIPTMIVRAYQPTTSDLTDLRYRRVLVPLDCSYRAECVLPVVTSLADFHDPQLIFAHVVSRPELPRRVPPTAEDISLVNQLVERNREEAARYLSQIQPQMISEAFDVRTRLAVSDNVAVTLHEIVEEEDADLVVLSAHGQTIEPKWPYGGATINFIVYGTKPLLIVQDLVPGNAILTNAEMAASEHPGH